jgi:mRNA interferase MazF
MVTSRGAIHWTDLGAVRGSEPGKLRPAVVIQSDFYTQSRLATIVFASITSNTQLAGQPGNVFLPASASGLPKDSTINVTQIFTVDENFVSEQVGAVPGYLMSEVDAGLRKVLAL